MNSKRTLNKVAIRQQQKFLLLLRRDDFQHDIAELRVKWAIRAEGFRSPIDLEQWWQAHGDNADDYEDKNYEMNRAEVLAAERRWRAKEISTPQFDTIKAEVNKRNPVNAFNHDIDHIVNKYRLPPRWKGAIQTYLFTNEERYTGTMGIAIQNSNTDEVVIKLDAYTTRQDLIDAWPNIKFYISKLKHRAKAKAQPFDIEVLERNTLAHRLRQQGKTYKVIAETLNTIYGSEYTYGEIPTMIKNYKKLIGTN